MNDAAVPLARLEKDSFDEMTPKTRDNVHTKPNEVIVESTANASKDQIFFHIDNLKLPSGKQIWQRKHEIRKHGLMEPSILTMIFFLRNGKHMETLLNSMKPFKRTSHLQHAGPVLPKLSIKNEPLSDIPVLSTSP